MKIMIVIVIFSVITLHGMKDESYHEFFELIKSLCSEGVEEMLNEDTSLLYKPSPKGEMPIHIAAGLSLPMVKVMLEKDKSLVNLRDKNNSTPLHEAAKNSSCIMEYLLENGANIEAVDNTGNTPIMYALRNNIWVKELLAKGARLDRTAKNGWTALHCATASGETIVMEMVHTRNANLLNIGDKDNTVPLHIAASRGHTDAITWLLEKGADVNSKEYKGTRAVHIAILRRNLTTTNLLIQHGAELPSSIKEQIPNMGQDATYQKLIEDIAGDGCDLHEWWARNRQAFMNKDIKKFVQPVYNDQQLKRKAEEKDLKGLRKLLKNGLTLNRSAGVFIVNVYKAISQAVKNDDVQALKKLQEDGIPLWLKDKRGNTPLHAALWSGKTKTTQWLLENPATAIDVEKQNDQNKTPVQLAVNNFQSLDVIQKRYMQEIAK